MRRPDLSPLQERLVFWLGALGAIAFIPETARLVGLMGAGEGMALGPVTVFLIKLAVVLVLSVAIALLTPKSNPQSQEPDPAKASDFDFPTTEEDRPVNQLMGIGLIQPNLVALGKLEEKAIKEEIEVGSGKDSSTEEIVVGYAYFIPMGWALGDKLDELREFRMNGKRTWPKSGTSVVTGGGSFQARTGDVLSVRGSGTGPSTIRFLDGRQSAVDSSLSSMSGNEDIVYKRTSFIVMPKAFIGDEVRTVPQYDVVGVMTSLFEGEENLRISDDANPAWMIRYLLEFHKRISPGRIDVDAFRAVAAALAAEGFGLSIHGEGQSAQFYIDEILRHIDGFLFESRQTGLMTLRLAREDYNPASLQVLTESHYRDLTLRRMGWEETFSELTIKHMSRRTWDLVPFKEYSVANEDLIGDRRRDTLSFPLATRPEAAGIIAARLLPKKFAPLAVGKFRVSAAVLDPNPGDVVKLRHSSMAGTGFQDLIVRILAVDSDSKSNWLDVDFTEDIFSIGTIDVVIREQSQFTPISRDILAAVRFPVVKDALPGMAPAGRAVSVLAARPDDLNAANYEVALGETLKGLRSFAGTGQLETSYAKTRYIDNSAVGFVVKSAIDVAAVTNTRGAAQRLATIAIIDSGGNWEIVSVQTITSLGGGRFRCTGNFRGVAGTPVVAHAINTRVYFPEGNGFDIASRLVNVSSAALAAPISLRFTPVNSDERGPETFVAHSYGYRAETPYPPAYLRATRDGSDVTLTWIARLRNGGLRTASVTDFPDMLNTSWPHEGTFRVSANDGFGPVIVDATSFVREGIATPQIYTIQSLLNGRLSSAVTVEI